MDHTGRRTDRVCITLHLDVEGTDSEGKTFQQGAHTLLVNRNGGVIVLNRSVEPDQQIQLQRKAHQEQHRRGIARVVGKFGRQSDGYVYGVELLDPSCDLWGVEFPEITQAEEAVARMLLECSYCHRREVVYLNERELKGFETNHGIARHCPGCEVPSIWVQAPREEPEPNGPGSDHAAAATNVREEPKGNLVKTRLTACVRCSGTDDELAVCDGMFPGGLSFRSKRHYPAGMRVELAVPFQNGAANIFVPVRVVQTDEIASAGLFRHAVEYARGAAWES